MVDDETVKKIVKSYLAATNEIEAADNQHHLKIETTPD
jgi:hypothetical protein